MSHLFYVHYHSTHRDIHSFPTRRSSDLGVAVVAHTGFTPQSEHVLGGYRVQGRQADAAEQMVAEGLALQEAGAAMLLMEMRSEEHTSELQSRGHLVCRLLLEKKNK